MASKHSISLKIYLTPDEYKILQGKANAVTLSLSRYGRLSLLSPFKRDLQSSQNLQGSYEALTLHLGQYYSLLSLMASDLQALSRQTTSLNTFDLRQLLDAVQTQVDSTRDELKALAQQLQKQEGK